MAKTSAVVTITNVDYTLKEYIRFKKRLVTIARSVMSNHNGGQHGYDAGVILCTAAYRKLVADTTAVFTFTAFTKPSRTPTYATDQEQFYTQEGVIKALKYLTS